MNKDQLKLENQLCFPVYALSRLITKKYQPYLYKMGITYPQYLVLLILWEQGKPTVNEISKRLYLNTNTVTPLLKRMEKQELINRLKSKDDERKVLVSLTEKGESLKEQAKSLPQDLAKNLCSDSMKQDDLLDLKKKLETVIQSLI